MGWVLRKISRLMLFMNLFIIRYGRRAHFMFFFYVGVGFTPIKIFFFEIFEGIYIKSFIGKLWLSRQTFVTTRI